MLTGVMVQDHFVFCVCGICLFVFPGHQGFPHHDDYIRPYHKKSTVFTQEANYLLLSHHDSVTVTNDINADIHQTRRKLTVL